MLGLIGWCKLYKEQFCTEIRQQHAWVHKRSKDQPLEESQKREEDLWYPLQPLVEHNTCKHERKWKLSFLLELVFDLEHYLEQDLDLEHDLSQDLDQDLDLDQDQDLG